MSLIKPVIRPIIRPVASRVAASSGGVSLLTGDRYISPTGDDEADGLTRETAWASFAKLSQWASALTEDGVGVVLAGAYDESVGNTVYQNGNGVNIRIDFEPGVTVDTSAAVVSMSPIAVLYAAPTPATWTFNLRGASFVGNNVLSANGIGGFDAIKLTVNGGGAVFDSFDDGVSMHGYAGNANVNDVVINDCTFQNCHKGAWVHVNNSRATHNRCSFIGRAGAVLGVGAQQSTVPSVFNDCVFVPATDDQVGIPYIAKRCIIGTFGTRMNGGNASVYLIDWEDCFVNLIIDGPGIWSLNRCYGFMGRINIRGSGSNESSFRNCVFKGRDSATKFTSSQGAELSAVTDYLDTVITGYGNPAFDSSGDATQLAHINANWTVDHCCLFGNISNFRAGMTIGTNLVTTDPLLGPCNTTNQADWAVAANSPCVGAGTDGGNIGFTVADLA